MSDIVQINYCGHCFSRIHLNRWFQNHVTCPVCRHDIRENNTNQFGAIGNDVSNSESMPNAYVPQPTQIQQTPTVQLDVTMSSPDLINNFLPLANTQMGNNSTDTSTGPSNRRSAYNASYYNYSYAPNSNGTSL